MSIWTRHPKEVGQTYSEHWYYAFRTGVSLIKISLKLWIHAFFPFIYTNDGSRDLIKVVSDMDHRSKEAKYDKGRE